MPRLPADPSLEHLRNQAKTLLKNADDPQARAFVRMYHPDPPAELKLADAQLIVARAYGFASWPKLRAHLDVIARYTSSPHKAPPSADGADEFLRLACLTYSTTIRRAGRRRDGRWRPSSRAPRCTTRPRPATSTRRERASRRRGAQSPAAPRPAPPSRGAARTAGSPCSTWPTRASPGTARSTSPGCCWTPAPTRTRASCGKACRPRSPRSPAPSGAARATRRRTATRCRWRGCCWRPAPTPPTRRPRTTCTGPRTTPGSSCCSSSATAAATAARGMPASRRRTPRRARRPRTA